MGLTVFVLLLYHMAGKKSILSKKKSVLRIYKEERVEYNRREFLRFGQGGKKQDENIQ